MRRLIKALLLKLGLAVTDLKDKLEVGDIVIVNKTTTGALEGQYAVIEECYTNSDKFIIRMVHIGGWMEVKGKDLRLVCKAVKSTAIYK